MWPNNHLIKRLWLWLMDLTSHLSRNRDSAGIETDLCQQIHCWFELKKTKEVGRNEWELLNFLDFTKLRHGTIWMQLCTIFQGKGKWLWRQFRDCQGCRTTVHLRANSMSSLVSKGGAEEIGPSLRAMWVILLPQRPG